MLSQRSIVSIASVAVALIAAGCSEELGAPEDRTQALIPDGRLYGVTVDDVSNLNAITTSLSRLVRKPTTRIVFDEYEAGVDPEYYTGPATAIHNVSFVMGEILDSFYMPDYPPDRYAARVVDYVSNLGDSVDIWEIGNEVNGEWVGGDVTAKLERAYDIVKGQGKVAALTLYYNEGCWESADHEMFRWAEANVPARLKLGLDYVLVSYYEDDCEGLQPNWQPVFDRLGAMFPNSKIGFGEVGTATASKKAAYLTRYYKMPIQHPRYIGGHFWWYFKQDMVPHTKSLHATLNDAIR